MNYLITNAQQMLIEKKIVKFMSLFGYLLLLWWLVTKFDFKIIYRKCIYNSNYITKNHNIYY